MLPPASPDPEPAWVPDLPEHVAQYGPSGPGAPVAPPPPDPTAPTRGGTGGAVSAMRIRSLLAQLALVATMIGSAALGYAIWRQRVALVDIRDGRPVSLQEAADVDAFVERALVIYLVVIAACAVLFLVWFHRAYKNLHAYRRTDFRPYWAVLGWMIPILNLWRPFQVASELASRSPMHRRDQAPRFVVLWWFALIASGVMSRLMSAVAQSNASLDADIMSRTVALGMVPFHVAGAVCGLLLVRDVTLSQRPFVTS